MAAELGKISRFSISEAQYPLDQAAYRRGVLRDIEAALTKARMDAEAIEYPVLAYFLEMALAEVKMAKEPINKDLADKKK